jgi:hypothetical protein
MVCLQQDHIVVLSLGINSSNSTPLTLRITLGNVGDSSTLPHLQKAAKDSKPFAEHAQWAIEQIESRRK